MKVRSLQDLYGEILTTDLKELINFTETNTLYYKTRIQKLQDLEETQTIQWQKPAKIDKEQAQLWLGARAVR